jgi:RHS repeat-associated protein
MGCLQLDYYEDKPVRAHERTRSHEPKMVLCWLSTDPLAEKFAGVSPYCYVMNNPLNLIDPTGMAPTDWYRNNTTGNVQWFNGSSNRSGYTNLGTSTNLVAGTGGLQLNSNGTATDMNSGRKYGPNRTIVSNSSTGETVKTGTVSDSTPTGMFFGGLGNTVLGIVGALGSGAYCVGTEGLGAIAGGSIAFTLSCGEIGIGCAQMGDAFSMNPDTELHNFSTVPGLIAAQNGSEYAPLIDGISGYASGSLSGGNVKGTIQAVKEISQGKSIILNGASAIDATLDAKGVIDGVKSADQTYKKNNP